jgi:hypothetical protein
MISYNLSESVRIHSIFELRSIVDEHVRDSFPVPVSQLAISVDVDECDIDVTRSGIDHISDRLDRVSTEVALLTCIDGYCGPSHSNRVLNNRSEVVSVSVADHNRVRDSIRCGTKVGRI